MKAVKAQELSVKVINRLGALSELSQLITETEVNIRAISAWFIKDEAFFKLIVSDNAKLKDALAKNNYVFSENSVVIAELTDKIGQLYQLTDKLKSANIDLTCVYGTTSKPDNEAIDRKSVV